MFLHYSCVFGKCNYRVLVRVSVCVCVCVCVCVFAKRNPSRNTKLEYTVIYENSLDEFDIELRRIKVKVNVGVQKFSPFTTIHTVRSFSSTFVQDRNLILTIYVHLILTPSVRAPPRAGGVTLCCRFCTSDVKMLWFVASFH